MAAVAEPVVRRTLQVAALLGLAAASGGCLPDSMVEVERTVEAPLTAPMPLDVQAENGSIDAKADGGQTVTVKAVVRATTKERAEAVAIRTGVRGGAFVVRAEWPDGRDRNEGCSFVVTAPGATSVRLRSSNGAIVAEGFAAPLDAETSNGSIRASDAVDVRATTSNGSVNLTNVGTPVTVRTSNGSVTARLAPSSTGPVDARTSNGSVTLEVGPGFAGEVGASTSNGRVHMPQGEGVSVTTRAKDDATAKFGAGTGSPASTLRASNGSITVRRSSGG